MNRRLIWILLLLAGLVFLSYYSVYHHPWISLTDCLSDPEKFDGALITSWSEPMIGEIYSDGFQLNQKGIPSIKVLADTSGLISGEYIGIKAIYHKEGYLESVIHIVANKRREKIWLSVIPVLLIGFLLLRYFHFNFHNWTIDLRRHA